MWKKIKQYDQYEINENGQVRRKNRFLKPLKCTNGYLQYGLCKNGKVKYFRIHRLLAQAFIPNPLNKPCINHIDGIRHNNALSNLEWVTISENHLHAIHVTKNRVIVPVSKGKFGKDHNKSKQFFIEYPNGEIVNYGSGLEFTRLTGFDHSSISWIRTHKNCSHLFRKGAMKGLKVHFE